MDEFLVYLICVGVGIVSSVLISDGCSTDRRGR